MGMSDKEKFLKLLSGLEKQYRNDQIVQLRLQAVYGEDADIPMYNIDALATPVVTVMADMAAMEQNNAMEEIFNFMYVQDFGRIKTTDGTQIRDGEDLWNVLNVADVVATLKKRFNKKD